jgi:tRNA(Ile)-lysidine synthase
MEITPLKGKYVIAVSGGVDSVVLLDLLNRQRQDNNLELIVAHFDHGIRTNSAADRKLVESLAAKYNLPFYFFEAKLGPKTSEQLAREARYTFLKGLVKQQSADSLITAHHQDDQLETAILNIIRGTGRKGLASLKSSDSVIRPLLNYSKTDIIKYAKGRKLAWHEDQTNKDIKYLRNYIRHQIIPRLDSVSKAKLIDLIKKQVAVNEEIDRSLGTILKDNLANNQIPRLWLNSLDDSLSRELLAAWLRENGLADFDRLTINRLATQAKTIGSNKKLDVYGGWQLSSSKDNLALEHPER